MAWLPNYQHRRKLTVDPTKVDANLTNFPTLVKLTSANFDFTKSTATGNDVRFTLADGTTLLIYERGRHDSTASKAEYWVKIPSVSATAPTEFYIYYSTDTGIADGANPTAVWDTNFKARWSLKENPTGGAGAMKDSTVNVNHGTAHGGMTSAQSVDGKIGRALDFDGVNDYVSFGNNANLHISGAITLEAWVKPAGFAELGAIIRNGLGFDLQYSMFTDTDRSLIFHWWDGAFKDIRTATNLIPLGQWTHIVALREANNTIRLYINGELRKTATGTQETGGGGQVNIGSARPGSTNQNFNGIIDETRISNITRSVAWLKATHNTGNDTLLTYGVEEAQKLVFDTGLGIDTIGVKSSVGISDIGSGVDIPKIKNLLSIIDSGAGTDIVALLNRISQTDIGSGIDAVKILSKIPITDTGTGMDTTFVKALLIIVDSGTGADTIDLLRKIQQADSGIAVEQIIIKNLLSVLDTGTGTDAVKALAKVSISDTGIGQDIVKALAKITLTDTGLGIDEVNLLVKIALIDTAAGTDAISLLRKIMVQDTGTAAEVIEILRGIYISDTGIGTDIVKLLNKLKIEDVGAGVDVIRLLGKIALADVGVGADAIQILRKVAVSDSGTATDVIQILGKVAVSDSGIAVDAVKMLIQIALTDEGVGIDAAKRLVSLSVSDTGIGTDALEVIKRIIPYLKKKYPYLEKEYPYLKKKYPYLHKGKIIR